jgi:gamma-glutamylcyclotransferase (GGCT)/AIG2-like uncharacterized protein YtfP
MSKAILNDANGLLESLSEDAKSYHLPFPMAVFGTLRKGCGNHVLMGSGEESGWRSFRGDYRYATRLRAFLPHFAAQGIHVFFKEKSSCPFEVFTYDPESWHQMIPNVDALEGFSPGSKSSRAGWGEYGYNRTLAYLHILPEDFKHRLFPEKGRPDLQETRDLKIPPEQWGEYPRLPCWIYSSGRENAFVVNQIDNAYPLIWYDSRHVNYETSTK